MDISTRKKISQTMKGHSNFEGHKHTHAEKIAIAFSQEGHKNAKNHKWAVNKNTGKETRVKPGANLPRGNKWGRTAAFKQWVQEEVLTEKKKVSDAISDFAEFAKQHLNLDTLPQIDINYDLEAAEKFGAFGGYYPEEQRIELNVAGRHTMDILRTLAHELVHYNQGTKEVLPEDAGDTGSPYENEANALAGVMMREYGKQNTHMFSEQLEENFIDGRNPEHKGDMARHGLKGKTITQLRKIRSSSTASPREKQLAHWYINMHMKEQLELTTEDLRKWFKEKWVRMDTKGNIKGDCAREPGEGKPKCLPIAKARAMDKKDRASAAQRKRREDPVADRAGKGEAPVNVRTEQIEYMEEGNKPTNPSLWSQAKSLARSKFDVYPSAYANGWAAKWYKSKGGGWKSISEKYEDDPANRLRGTDSLAAIYKKDTPGQKMRTLKQLKEMVGRKVRCENCDGWMVKGQKHDCTMKEARMSAALKLQRAFQREQEKSAASRARAEKLLNPTPTPTPPKK